MRELYQVWPSSLSCEQVDKITAIARRQSVEAATVFLSAESMQGIRSCTVRWLEDEWAQSLLWPYVDQANKGGFHVAIDRRLEMHS